MAANLSIDRALIELAMEVSGDRSDGQALAARTRAEQAGSAADPCMIRAGNLVGCALRATPTLRPYRHANTGCSSSATRVVRPASSSRNW
jgi:hypothetical protein